MPKTMTPIALVDRAAQTGPDEFATWQNGKVCSLDTTIGELYEWVKERTGFSGPHCSHVTIMFAEADKNSTQKEGGEVE